MGRNDHLTPIVTIVLYHGTEPWDAPKKLSEMMELEEIDPILKQMVQMCIRDRECSSKRSA